MPTQHFTQRPYFRSAIRPQVLGLLFLALIGMAGCSSSEPEPVASAPVAAAPAPSMDIKEEDSSSGEAYGSGAYATEESSDEELSPMDEMRMMGMGQEAGPGRNAMPGPGMNGMSEYDMSGMPGSGSSEYGNSGYGMSGMSGMPGMPGNGTPQFAAAQQFVRTNCINCHGAQQTKGDLRLDVVSDDFDNTGNATAWHSVLEQLESGSMPPPSVTRRPDAKQQLPVVAWIKSSLIKADFVPLEDRDYLSQAKYAFSVGKEGKAVELLYAHAVAADDQVALETLSQTRWFDLGVRPILALRFAVGVDLDADETIEDLKPLGVSQSGSAGGASSMSMARGSQPGNGANTKSERTFQQLTGDFGSEMVTSFESRWMDGRLGTPFKDVEPAAPPKAPTNNGMGMMGMSGMEGMMSGMEGMSSGYPGGPAGGPGGSAAAEKHDIKGSVLTPGLVYIGTGKQGELLQESIAQGFDGLFLFDVKAAHKRRGGLIENSTRLRFMGLDGKTVAATSTLVNIDIERAQLRGHEDDSLSKNIDRLFTGFDAKAKLSELPALKPEHAHDRIRALLADPKTDDLVKLFEARLYRSMDLLSDDELAKIYQIVLRGNEGLALASGTIDDRKLVLNAIVDKVIEARIK